MGFSIRPERRDLSAAPVFSSPVYTDPFFWLLIGNLLFWAGVIYGLTNYLL